MIDYIYFEGRIVDLFGYIKAVHASVLKIINMSLGAIVAFCFENLGSMVKREMSRGCKLSSLIVLISSKMDPSSKNSITYSSIIKIIYFNI